MSNAGRIVQTVATSDGTATKLFGLALAEGQSIVIHANVIGQRQNNDTAGISVWGVFKRVSAGNVTIVGSAQGTTQEDASGSPVISLNANTTTQEVEVLVTGVSSQNWNWTGMIDWVRVTA